MTDLEALATLESAVLECKKRTVNTPEVSEALDLLERYVWPKWLVPQFRHEASDGYGSNDVDREGQQQVLRATFPGIRNAVRELISVRMDALARKFYETHDMRVPDEIYCLAREYGKLKEPCNRNKALTDPAPEWVPDLSQVGLGVINNLWVIILDSIRSKS